MPFLASQTLCCGVSLSRGPAPGPYPAIVYFLPAHLHLHFPPIFFTRYASFLVLLLLFFLLLFSTVATLFTANQLVHKRARKGFKPGRKQRTGLATHGDIVTTSYETTYIHYTHRHILMCRCVCIAFPWQSARQTTRPRPRERREREILVTIAKRDESPSPSSSPCPSLLLLLPLFVPNNFVVYAIYSFLSAVETKKASEALKRGWRREKIIVVEL